MKRYTAVQLAHVASDICHKTLATHLVQMLGRATWWVFWFVLGTSMYIRYLLPEML